MCVEYILYQGTRYYFSVIVFYGIMCCCADVKFLIIDRIASQSRGIIIDSIASQRRVIMQLVESVHPFVPMESKSNDVQIIRRTVQPRECWMTKLGPWDVGQDTDERMDARTDRELAVLSFAGSEQPLRNNDIPSAVTYAWLKVVRVLTRQLQAHIMF